MNLGAGYNEPPKDEPEGVHPRGQHRRDLNVGGQGHCNDAPRGEEEQVQEDKEEVPEEFGCMHKMTRQHLQPWEAAEMKTECWHSKTNASQCKKKSSCCRNAGQTGHSDELGCQ